MKFSIVIPLFNKQQSIRRAIYSAIDQIGLCATQYEIIVVNDGSTDDSLAIAKTIQHLHADRRIVVYSQANAGVAAARNKGIELACSDYISFLDADDSYEPNFLNEIKSLIHTFPQASMFATAYRFVNTSTGIQRDAQLAYLGAGATQQLLGDYFHCAAHGDLPITSSSVCIKRKALEKVDGFPIGENMGEDQSVWSQIALIYNIAISQKVCANYFESTQTSLMKTVAPSHEMPFSKRLQKQLDRNEIPLSRRSSIEKYISGHLLDLVRRNLQCGDVERARSFLDDLRARKQAAKWAYWSLRARFASVV